MEVTPLNLGSCLSLLILLCVIPVPGTKAQTYCTLDSGKRNSVVYISRLYNAQLVSGLPISNWYLD